MVMGPNGVETKNYCAGTINSILLGLDSTNMIFHCLKLVKLNFKVSHILLLSAKHICIVTSWI
jgi:hypothetical protein